MRKTILFFLSVILLLSVTSLILSVCLSISKAFSESSCKNEILKEIYKKGYIRNEFLDTVEPIHLFQDENGVIYYKNYILHYPNGIKNLSFEIPENITVVAAGCFSHNEYLESITLGSNVLFIDHAAFEFCTKLKTVSFSSKLLYTGSLAFSNCYSLKSVQLPDTVRFIGTQAFAESGIEDNFKIPKEIEFIGDEAFAKTSITSFKIQSNFQFYVGEWLITKDNLESSFILYVPTNYIFNNTTERLMLYSCGTDTQIVYE